jgi:hypothetical protein
MWMTFYIGERRTNQKICFPSGVDRRRPDRSGSGFMAESFLPIRNSPSAPTFQQLLTRQHTIAIP